MADDHGMTPEEMAAAIRQQREAAKNRREHSVVPLRHLGTRELFGESWDVFEVPWYVPIAGDTVH